LEKPDPEPEKVETGDSSIPAEAISFLEVAGKVATRFD
jgi:hypothetical protein